MTKLLMCDLQLFAEDGGMDVGTSGVAEGSMSSVDDGQFATDDGMTTDSNDDAEDKYASFDELIADEYKDPFEKKIKSTLDKRMRSHNKELQALKDFKEQVAPVFDTLAVKYGVTDPSNIEAILQGVNADNSFYEEYAMNNGVTVEQAKQLIQAERVTKQFEQQQAEQAREQELREKYNGWLQQAELVQQKFPAFNFELESENDNFRRLLNSGVDVETAYTVIHRDEIMNGAVTYGYQRSQEEMAAKRTSRQSRPNENGVSSQQASQLTDDMSRLSRADRQILNDAVARGERITADNFRKYLPR